MIEGPPERACLSVRPFKRNEDNMTAKSFDPTGSPSKKNSPANRSKHQTSKVTIAQALGFNGIGSKIAGFAHHARGTAGSHAAYMIAGSAPTSMGTFAG